MEARTARGIRVTIMASQQDLNVLQVHKSSKRPNQQPTNTQPAANRQPANN